MRLRELLDKELVSIDQGRRFGSMHQMDLLFHPETGQIEALEWNQRGFFSFFLWSRTPTWRIPWQAIRKIGPDLILFETNTERPKHEMTGDGDDAYMHRPADL